MEDDRWELILRTEGRADGNWVPLPEHGWGAAIAFAAGPGRARVHDIPLQERLVKHSSTTAGRTREWTTPMTRDEVTEISAFINQSLADINIPPAPHTWWEIDLPDGVTLDDLEERVEGALQSVTSPDVGPSQALREAEAIFGLVDGLYGEPRQQ